MFSTSSEKEASETTFYQSPAGVGLWRPSAQLSASFDVES